MAANSRPGGAVVVLIAPQFRIELVVSALADSAENVVMTNTIVSETRKRAMCLLVANNGWSSEA